MKGQTQSPFSRSSGALKEDQDEVVFSQLLFPRSRMNFETWRSRNVGVDPVKYIYS